MLYYCLLMSDVWKLTSILHSVWLLILSFISPEPPSMSRCAYVKLAEWLMQKQSMVKNSCTYSESLSSDAFISSQCNSVSMATSPWVFRIATLHLNFFLYYYSYGIGISNKRRKYVVDELWPMQCWQLHLLPQTWKDRDVLLYWEVPPWTGDTAEQQDKIVMRLIVY